MATLGTHLVGTVPFAGDHPAESVCTSAGEAQAVLLPGILSAGTPASLGAATGTLSPVLLAGMALRGAGFADGTVPGSVPRNFVVAEAGQADGLVLASAIFCVLAEAHGDAGGQVCGYPMFLGEGVRVDFTDARDFPKISFKEVF